MRKVKVMRSKLVNWRGKKMRVGRAHPGDRGPFVYFFTNDKIRLGESVELDKKKKMRIDKNDYYEVRKIKK